MDVFSWMKQQTETRPIPAQPKAARSGNPGRKHSYPQEVYDRIASMLDAGGMTMQGIADAAGVKRGVVAKMKIRLRAGKGVPLASRPITPDMVEQIFTLVASGFTVKEAAIQVGVSKTTAEGIIRHKCGGAKEVRESTNGLI